MRAAATVAVLALAGGCGDNLSGFEPWILDTLPPDQGVWVRTPEFDVAPGTEIQNCYFFQVPDLGQGGDLWIDRYQMALNPGSHHMNVFRVNTVLDLGPDIGTPVDLGGVSGTLVHDGECWRSGNWSDWPLVANSQQSSPDEPVLEWGLPDGVASRFTPGEWLMIQVHYVNATTQETPWKARAGINMFLSRDGDTVEMGTLFATQQSIRICRSQPTPSYSGTCSMPVGTHTVAAANGHFHSRGRRFSIWAWDGVSTTRPPDSARFYQSEAWAEPDMASGLDVVLAPGAGIWWTCDYQWIEPEVGCEAIDARDPEHAGDCCYTFGPIVDTSEHCNVFLYYYPKSEDVNCF